MVFDSKMSIGIPPSESAFSENAVYDLDLWTVNAENVIWTWYYE